MIVREQRSEEGNGVEALSWTILDGTEVVLADDWRDLYFELSRLQAAVLGDPPPGP